MLCLALLVAAIPVILPVFTSATAADDQEEQLLGTLSQRFEASGPGVISSGSGDAGGKSYGAYQFSSRSDIPRAFFRWCQSSSDTYYRSIGNRLSAAYDADGGYGSNFDATWRALANEDSDGFLRVQRNYVRRSYYDPIVRSIESAVPGFDMDNYSIACVTCSGPVPCSTEWAAPRAFPAAMDGAAPPASLCGPSTLWAALPISLRPSSSRPFTTKAAPCGSLSQTPTAL